MKKNKIFLGGYINSSNAQNLNCLSLSKYLNKNRFEIRTMSLYSGNLSIDENLRKEIKIFNCFKPFLFSRKLAYLWGIISSDIVYLPKGEETLLTNLLVSIFNKKSFKTVEGILDKQNLDSVIDHFGTYENFINSFKSFDKIFSITEFLKNYNLKYHNIKYDKKILYLGTDIDTFLNEDKNIKGIKNIIYIGRILQRKGIYDLLNISKSFPLLSFHIVGEGGEEENMKEFIKINKLKNIKIHGKLNHNQMSLLLKNIDLHVFPSRSEGFPKVTLETAAAAGVPSLVYGNYGASEWITHEKDGFVVDTVDEMKEIIQKFVDKPEALQQCSQNAIIMAKKFDWKVLIKDWEEEIVSLHENKIIK